MALIRDEFVPLMVDVPGFIWYVAGANPETRDQFSVGVFEDEAGAAESNRRAAEWGAGRGGFRRRGAGRVRRGDRGRGGVVRGGSDRQPAGSRRPAGWSGNTS